MLDLVDLAHDSDFLPPIFFLELLSVERLLIRILDPSADIPITHHNREGPLAQRLLVEADGTSARGVGSTWSCRGACALNVESA